jgi:Leucine-rich repeat (LRR) protein
MMEAQQHSTPVVMAIPRQANTSAPEKWSDIPPVYITKTLLETFARRQHGESCRLEDVESLDLSGRLHARGRVKVRAQGRPASPGSRLSPLFTALVPSPPPRAPLDPNQRMECLEALPKLTQLTLAGNRLSRLSNLGALQHLTALDVSSNDLHSLTGVHLLTQLQVWPCP